MPTIRGMLYYNGMMSMSDDVLIEADQLCLARQGQEILRGVSLKVTARDFITIVGPNGAGKTMLLKAMMGLEKIQAGAVIRRTGLRIGYVPQRLVADPTIPISVRRFLTLRKSATAQSVSDIAAQTKIAEILECPLHVLSGGELQRVLLARALLSDPDLLVLDEPAQNLDVSGQLAFYSLLETLYKERPLAILMVSHDLHLVMASTKKVFCLFHHVCCFGEPHIVARDPEFVALFGQDMAKLMAVYQHDHHHSHEGEGHDHYHHAHD